MTKNKIKAQRQAIGFTQQELADKAGLSLRTIQRVESGTIFPKGHTLKALSKAFNLDPESLTQEQELCSDEDLMHKIKVINLSALALLGIPYGNLIFPIIFWRKYRSLDPLVMEAGKKIINLQILWSVVFYLLLGISPFLPPSLSPGFPLILLILLIGILTNLMLIAKLGNEINKGTLNSFLPQIKLI